MSQISSIALAIVVFAGSATASVACEGDCNRDGRVQIDEIATLISAAFAATTTACDWEAGGAARVPSIENIQAAVNHALGGCSPLGAETPAPPHDLQIRAKLPYNGIKSLVLTADGRHLYAASGCRSAKDCSFGSNGPGAIDILARDDDGGVELRQTVVDGIDGVDGISNLNSIALSPDGRNLYALSLGDAVITSFRRDRDGGTLTLLDTTTFRLENVVSPRALAVSADGRQVYLLARQAIAVFARDATGLLSLSSVTSGDGTNGPLTALRAMQTTSDGAHLIVAGLYGFSILNRDATTGGVVLETTYRRLRGIPLDVKALSWSRDQRHLFLGIPGGLVAADPVDAIFIDFVLVGEPSYGRSPSVTASAAAGDDTVLAVAEDTMARIGRNPISGALTLRSWRRSYDFVGAAAIVVSPDSRFAYSGGTLGIVVVELEGEIGDGARRSRHR